MKMWLLVVLELRDCIIYAIRQLGIEEGEGEGEGRAWTPIPNPLPWIQYWIYGCRASSAQPHPRVLAIVHFNCVCGVIFFNAMSKGHRITMALWFARGHCGSVNMYKCDHICNSIYIVYKTWYLEKSSAIMQR